MVRDLLLGRPNEDVDLVVEGSGIDFAHALAGFTGGRCHPHEPFLTAVVTLPDGHKVDVASARTEFYRTPAALPEVMTSLLRQDLFRRDFTINSLAIALHGDRHGQLIDFFGGRRDLDHREIRVLHSLSFIDDPTRAFRAVRYARRLDFRIAPDTRHLIATAVAEDVFRELSGQRLRRELEHLLDEGHGARALEMLAELDLITAIAPSLRWSETVHAFLLDVEGLLGWYRVERLGPSPPTWLLMLGGLGTASGGEALPELVQRLCVDGDTRRVLLGLEAQVDAIVTAAEPGLTTSARVERVEGGSPESVLLAMARLDMPSRRLIARAVEDAVRTPWPVSGAELIAAGIRPGPHVGAALREARNAVLDGAVQPESALEWTIGRAKALAEAS